jgi:hypothetical protein
MRRGFTVLELAIATALAAVLCLTAWSAVAGAAQAMSVANRLSIDNALLREGSLAALDDLDTWRSLDDPEDPARQPLRACPGLPSPFAPLTSAATAIDPDQSTRAAWFQGDPVHGDSTEFGDWALLGKIDDADPERRWRHEFISRITDRLGYYALIDYAPGNTLYSWTAADGHVVPEFWNNRALGPGYFYSANFSRNFQPRDLIGVTRGTFYTITAEPAYAASSRQYFTWWGDNPAIPGWSKDDAFTRCGQVLDQLPLRPAHWPALEAVTRRFVVGYRRWETGTVVLHDPVDGQVVKLFISTTTTTLRGARRQRDAVAGWAHPGQPTLDG